MITKFARAPQNNFIYDFIMRKFSIILEKYMQSGNSEMTLDRSVSSSKQWKSGYSRVDVVAYIVLSASILDYSTF